MNEELILKAAVKFKGVWPDVREDQDCLIVCKQHGEIRASMINSSEIDEDLDKERFNLICTRTEYEAFIDSLFEGAPEDAEYYLPAESSYAEGWIMLDGDSCKFCESGGSQWFDTIDTRGVRTLIPRPRKQEVEQVPFDKDGIPPVGTMCEAVWLELPDGGAREWKQCLVMGAYDDLVWINVHEYDSDGLYSGYPLTLQKSSVKFRPLKTEAEKERERLEDLLCVMDSIGTWDCKGDTLEESVCDTFVENTWQELCEVLRLGIKVKLGATK
ncbi:MAG: hypothetical protein ACPHUL_00420 [Marinomonas gallaica]